MEHIASQHLQRAMYHSYTGMEGHKKAFRLPFLSDGILLVLGALAWSSSFIYKH
jgi:hypothetical protein